MVYVTPCSWPCNISMILVSWYKGETSTKRPLGTWDWSPVSVTRQIFQQTHQCCGVFQSADCGWGWLIWFEKVDEFSSYTGMLYSCCTSELSKFTIRNFVSSMRAKHVFPYGPQELLLPYCDIKSGPIEKDGSTVPRTQRMHSSAEGFQEVIEVHVIHRIPWLKLTYCWLMEENPGPVEAWKISHWRKVVQDIFHQQKQWKMDPEWRCISYWKWTDSMFMLVFVSCHWWSVMSYLTDFHTKNGKSSPTLGLM